MREISTLRCRGVELRVCRRSMREFRMLGFSVLEGLRVLEVRLLGCGVIEISSRGL